MRLSSFLLFWLVLNSLHSQELVYPKTLTVSTTDTFFSKYIIKDEFRWLEDVDSAEVKHWKKEQNQLSEKYLSKAAFKTDSEESILKYGQTNFNHPVKKGKYYFKKKVYNESSSPALYYQKEVNDIPILLVDPNTFFNKENIQITNYEVSNNSDFLAYNYSRNGSDWTEIKVVSLNTGKELSDHLLEIRVGMIAWKDSGFYYSSQPNGGKFNATELNSKIYYHKLGDDQSKDSVIFKRSSPHISYFFTTNNERFLILHDYSIETKMTSIYYIDHNEEYPHLTPLIVNTKHNIEILYHYNGQFIAQTTYKSDNGSIVSIDPKNPFKWKTIINEFSKSQLLEAVPFRDKLILFYQMGFTPLMLIVNYDGEELYSLKFPVGSSAEGFCGNENDDELLFNFSSYTLPPLVYKFNIKTFNKTLTKYVNVNYDFEKIEYFETEYESKDGIKVPLLILHKKNLKLDGSNPTILSAYGGFGKISQTSFDPSIIYFLEKGGVFAFAGIRGGGDNGADWSKAGRGLNKQVSFNDFISAAEYLIRAGYTNSQKLVSMGSSNGGLVVAAAAIQRPELFKAVVSVVAPLDMLRFQKFTIGDLWKSEYGNIEDSLGFINLLNYSPLHNIKEDINYPAFLVMTSDNDDRVPPFHSYKFVAKLQNRAAQRNPILLRVEKKAGHNGASTYKTFLKTESESIGFIMKQLFEN